MSFGNVVAASASAAAAEMLTDVVAVAVVAIAVAVTLNLFNVNATFSTQPPPVWPDWAIFERFSSQIWVQSSPIIWQIFGDTFWKASLFE